jgi:preprotein translocase subunit SecY
VPGRIRGLPDRANRGLRMLTAFVRAFQTPDLRKKMLITLGLIALFRFGATLPTPGIDEKNVAFCSNAATAAGSSTAGVLAIVNLLAGRGERRRNVEGKIEFRGVG